MDALLRVLETTFSRSNHSLNSIFSSRHVARNDFVWNYPARQVCVHCVLGVKTRLSSPLTDKKLLETNLLYLHTLTCYVVARPHFGDIFTFGAYCYILSSSTYVRHKTAHLGANSNAQECEWSWSSYKTNHLIIIEKPNSGSNEHCHTDTALSQINCYHGWESCLKQGGWHNALVKSLKDHHGRLNPIYGGQAEPPWHSSGFKWLNIRFYSIYNTTVTKMMITKHFVLVPLLPAITGPTLNPIGDDTRTLRHTNRVNT